MTRTSNILIIEDTASLAMVYASRLEEAGYAVSVANSGAAALDYLANGNFDAILLDLQLPDCDGLELLGSNQSLSANGSTIVITADGSINRAISAMRLGAYDFLVKPLAAERLVTTVRNAIERFQLAREVKSARKLADREQFHGFIGRSLAMQAVYKTIESVADSRATIFVTGESGVGKEVAAEAIHRASKRREKPFIAINCGAIPENLLESELFGHVRGAFTGATEHRIGAARAADGGTLFLDEICEMDIKLQVKLLRFLQTGKIQRVGSSTVEPVDVRVICATNRNPTREVAEGRFREDLFYRLAVIPLELPPLRERGQDIELIARAFLERFEAEEGKTFDPLAPEFVKKLVDYGWPGNVRELQNVIRRLVILNEGPSLTMVALSMALGSGSQPGRATPGAALEVSDTANPADVTAFEGMTLDEVERTVIEGAITRCGGSLPAAAKSLGVSPSTLYRKRERWLDHSAA